MAYELHGPAKSTGQLKDLIEYSADKKLLDEGKSLRKKPEVAKRLFCHLLSSWPTLGSPRRKVARRKANFGLTLLQKKNWTWP